MTGLLLRQIRFESKAFWRNPAAAFFTFIFPLIFLVIFNMIFGDEVYDRLGPNVSASNFFVPAIVAFSVINACYTSLAMGLTFARDQGQLKRVRGTPLPAWLYFAARIIHQIWVAAILVVIVCAFGVVFYDVDLPGAQTPAFLISLIVGAAVFSALGFAISGFIPNADAAPPVLNGTLLPLLFISDIFIPSESVPDAVGRFADLFPIKHFSNAVLEAFNPFTTGSGFSWSDLAVMAVWGVAGLLIAARFFSWEPRK